MLLKLLASLALLMLDWGFYTSTDLCFWRHALRQTLLPWFLFIVMNGVLLAAIWMN